MSAAELIQECQRAGIRLSAPGGRLRAEALRGVLTPELRHQLTVRKPELLAVYAIRARMRGEAQRLGIPRTAVDGLPVEELEAIAEQVALAGDHLDGKGDLLAHSLQVFYLRCLVGKEPSP